MCQLVAISRASRRRPGRRSRPERGSGGGQILDSVAKPPAPGSRSPGRGVLGRLPDGGGVADQPALPLGGLAEVRVGIDPSDGIDDGALDGPGWGVVMLLGWMPLRSRRGMSWAD